MSPRFPLFSAFFPPFTISPSESLLYCTFLPFPSLTPGGPFFSAIPVLFHHRKHVFCPLGSVAFWFYDPAFHSFLFCFACGSLVASLWTLGAPLWSPCGLLVVPRGPLVVPCRPLGPSSRLLVVPLWSLVAPLWSPCGPLVVPRGPLVVPCRPLGPSSRLLVVPLWSLVAPLWSHVAPWALLCPLAAPCGLPF
jgi:hypothetical protein